MYNTYGYPYQNYYKNNKNNKNNNNDERLAGGFAFPFLLGGVTGAAIAPAFWNNNYNNQGVFIPAPYGPYGRYPAYYYPVRKWF